MLKEETMTKSELPGVPAGGLRTVGQIRGTNDLILHVGQNGMAVALELLSTHTPGAPVVDDHNEFIGFISEVDVLRALEAGKDLSKLNAEDLMAHDRIAVTAETTIEEAVKIMKEKRLLNLPVKQNGRVPTL
jgi:CBS domain-containing protein